MQSSNRNTTEETFLDELTKIIKIDTTVSTYSNLDKEYKEIFAEIVGRKLSSTVYLSENIQESKLRSLTLNKGDIFDATKLVDLNYRKVDRVWEVGEFSVLGDVVIIWPHSMKNLLRISLWGDNIEHIELVEVDSRRKIKDIDSKEILDTKSDSVVGNENLQNSKVIFLTEDISNTTQVGINRIAGIYNYTDLHTTAMVVKNFKSLGYNIWYLSRNLEKAERLQNDILQYIDRFFEASSTLERNLNRGFLSQESKLLLLTDLEVMGEIDISEHKSVKSIDGASLEILKRIVPGDYLVHEDHGIGLFDGVKDIDGEKFLDIHYAKSDRLLIPFTALDKVTKYVGTGNSKPKLTGLNSGIWSRISKSAKKMAKSIAKELLALYALRHQSNTKQIVSNDNQVEEYWDFVNKFEYSDTEDQIIATRQILQDFQNSMPMDRLLVGDVGFGKTEIAMRAVYAVVNAGMQVAILVPTTVLSLQHLEVFKERFKDYPYIIKSLSRFNTKKEEENILEGISRGSIDIVIGTHSLLTDKVKFKNLGMVIIDEEQKFGVKQKEHLKSIRVDTNVLSMTATPIPRTLNMSLMGIRDISVLATPPQGRKDIKNEFLKYSMIEIKKVIQREIEREGQVFFLHNRVGTIQHVQRKISEAFPENTVDILHGQMSNRRIERVMGEFVEGKIDILICTTIIENGIDIANANTLIVDDINMYGLSQLYQIRGRIGRGDRQAYACFLYDKLRGNSALRVSALKESQGLGSGFLLSNRDLEIRGAGDILGRDQSGAINSVGYGLYTQMLSEQVQKLKPV